LRARPHIICIIWVLYGYSLAIAGVMAANVIWKQTFPDVLLLPEAQAWGAFLQGRGARHLVKLKATR